MHASYQVAPRTAWTKRLRPPHDWLTGRDVGSGGGEIGCEKLAAQRIGFKKMTLVIAIVSAIRFFRVPSYPAVISGAGRKSHSSVHHTELRYGSYRVTKCQINDRRSKHRQMAVLAIPVSLGGPCQFWAFDRCSLPLFLRRISFGTTHARVAINSEFINRIRL
jgi:hypothetical protein